MLTIAWDIDDVLNALMRQWFETYWRPRHPDCRLRYAQIDTNPPHTLLGVSLADYLQSLDNFRLSPHYAQMPPDPEIQAWFQQYGHAFRHMALTAVPRKAAPVSAAWVTRHFGDWIRTFHFVPSARPGDIPTGYEATKAAYLQWLDRVDLFIDDHPDQVQSVAAQGIKSFLLSRPWNSGGMRTTEILAALTALLS